MATPELFSETEEQNSFNQDTNINNGNEPSIFDNPNSEEKNEEQSQIEEPEMFEEPNLEDNFEIPAFLRRQKN